jgi:hypothetical protein
MVSKARGQVATGRVKDVGKVIMGEQSPTPKKPEPKKTYPPTKEGIVAKAREMEAEGNALISLTDLRGHFPGLSKEKFDKITNHFIFINIMKKKEPELTKK